jgi:two-component system OmpR family response regulator
VTEPFRVIICDDSLGFPALVKAWLAADERFVVVGMASGGERAKELIAQERPDLLVLDLLLPDVPDPPALVARLHEIHAPLRVMLVSSLRMEELRNAGEAAGTEGVCSKGASAEELTGALYAVATAAGSSTQNVAP